MTDQTDREALVERMAEAGCPLCGFHCTHDSQIAEAYERGQQHALAVVEAEPSQSVAEAREALEEASAPWDLQSPSWFAAVDALIAAVRAEDRVTERRHLEQVLSDFRGAQGARDEALVDAAIKLARVDIFKPSFTFAHGVAVEAFWMAFRAALPEKAEAMERAALASAATPNA